MMAWLGAAVVAAAALISLWAVAWSLRALTGFMRRRYRRR